MISPPSGRHRLERQLRGFAAQAPPDFARSVLGRLGLSDEYIVVEEEVARLFIAYNPRGVSLVSVAGSAEEFEEQFQRRFDRPLRRASEPPAQLLRAVKGESTRDRIAFDLRGLTGFGRAVLDKAREIPRGEVRTYAWVAREVGRPQAVRAVGTALGLNPVPVLIPCHRVVRSGGHIGEYVFGEEIKRALLQQEGLDLEETERLAAQGVQFMGSKTTRIFCFPSCWSARQIRANHRVRFKSSREAREAGFRPCKRCRPAAPVAA